MYVYMYVCMYFVCMYVCMYVCIMCHTHTHNTHSHIHTHTSHSRRLGSNARRQLAKASHGHEGGSWLEGLERLLSKHAARWSYGLHCIGSRRERERASDIYIYIYIYTHTHTHRKYV